jgi:hypothetical protein
MKNEKALLSRRASHNAQDRQECLSYSFNNWLAMISF